MDKLSFNLDIEGDWPPVSSENVWCEQKGGNFILKNTPFFISGLAVNDVFTAEIDSVNNHIFEFSIVKESGHSVIWFMNNDEIEISKFKKSIISLGCRVEGLQQFSLYSIDVPVGLDVDALDEIIDEFEVKGLDFAFPVWRH